MDIKESNNMNLEDEFNHWWIRTRFLYLKKAYQKFFSNFSKNIGDILEIGCGTGVNLKFLHSFVTRQKIYGVDSHLEKETMFLKKKLDDISNIDFLILMDVLEHVDDDKNQLDTWLKKLNPNGIVFITVPAYEFLWSHHDEYLEHKRRYTKKMLIELGQKCSLEPLKIHYIFSFLVPVVFILRKLAPKYRLYKDKDNSTLGLKKHSPFINSLMIILGKLESLMGGSPFGTSVVGIFKKC